MAGIGFELRKMMRRKTLLSLLQAYAYAGVIGSGPWVLSIVGILLVGFLSLGEVNPELRITQFQTSVTYLVATSLIYTGLVQVSFTRFIADRIFEKKWSEVLPNVHGLLALVLIGAAVLGTLAIFALFPNESVVYRLEMFSGFTLLSGIWVLATLLSGIKRYRAIFYLFAFTYTFIVIVSVVLRPLGLEGLLGGFVLGQYVLLAGMWYLVVKEFRRGKQLIAFDFLTRGKLYPVLVAVGFIYNLGIWADKFMFWADPATSQRVIGALHASIIYDLPVFLAYLSIIPGMAVFLVVMETDFASYNEKFYSAVRHGGSLAYIQSMRDEMVYAVQQGLGGIAKVQTLAVLVTFVAAPYLLRWLGISDLYLPLLYVQVLGAGLQVGVMAVLNVFFYLSQMRTALLLCALFLGLNVVLTGITLRLGAAFYGYGFTLAQLVTLVVGLQLLTRRFNRLEYRTFMLQ